MLSILELILPLITNVIGRVIPDANQAATVNAELQKALIDRQADIDRAVAEAAKVQAEVNLKEAESPSLFVAGWRPAIGWLCGAGVLYVFAVQPTVAWLCAMAGLQSPPLLDTSALMTLLLGMLGLGGLRTIEKTQGVESNTLKTVIVKKK